MPTILITGATSGFGQATAELFADKGWNLILTGRRTQYLNDLYSKLHSKTAIHTITLDVRDTDQVFQTLSELPPPFKEIDVLINNAGLALGLETADQANLSDWHQMIETNITGLVNVTRAVLPQMKTANRGYIINIGSIAANTPYIGGNVYGATKAFVDQFTKNLRTDLLGTKIRATTIAPGLAETEFSIVRFKGDKNRAEQVYKDLKPLAAEDIANTIDWLVETPEHMNVNHLEIMPTCQTWAGVTTKPN
ncbi:Serine 3-dehydrogenase [Piscirickettsia salmonis]|uniref:SDR family NAD(P)-dependent oxidoreductase n=1 Tax=Piscirickettsia salmonis TaxID=1238 RepID=UPI0012B7D32D|nr:SDR family NAD(P)-dependent oxidoreductase [Piscirickettsia salmonis]QGP48689.1 Serine 3-dehydrogenase [Piscirickettsia salmonis]QGP52721.1 Serine 3-dehydrogenase [Piscirickettsia salmonis]QGP57584.1 Serine 3-dehydrogenase [Piscirickettsia salmonis]QGP62289.1 Serine 3-dehydrogenase [Piscirickettsia salmonis]